MSAFARLLGCVIFALAFLSQPLALDACALSCEAARAARVPSVAAPCHHTTSCATQISQPTTSGATPVVHAVLPAIVTVELPRPTAVARVSRVHDALTSSSPPTTTQLRL